MTRVLYIGWGLFCIAVSVLSLGRAFRGPYGQPVDTVLDVIVGCLLLVILALMYRNRRRSGGRR